MNENNQGKRVVSYANRKGAKRLSLVLGFATLLMAANTSATPVRLNFSGLVTNLGASFSNGPDLSADQPFSIGDKFSGFAVYESDTAVSYSYSSSSWDLSQHLGAIREFSVTFDNHGAVYWDQSRVTNTNVQWTMASVSEYSYKDNLNLFAVNNSSHTQAFNGDPALLGFSSSYSEKVTDWYAYSLNLLVDGGDLTAGTLPYEAYDHSGFIDSFRLGYQSIAYSNDQNHRYGGWSSSISGRLSTVEIVGVGTVPEPASIALLGLGLAGLGFSRRRNQ